MSAVKTGIRTEFLFELKIQVQLPMDLGPGPEGQRVIFMARSGSFDGPKLKGEVIPMSGGDWSRVRSDGSGDIDVRLCLRTDDGAELDHVQATRDSSSLARIAVCSS